MSAWGPELRIARREAWHAKGRTALVVAMIGVPVLAIVALAVLLRTARPTEAQLLPHDMGTADATITAVGGQVTSQTVDGDVLAERGGPERHWTGAAIARAVGPGARAIPASRTQTVYRTREGYAVTSLRGMDLTDPLTRGMLTLTAGRAPRGTGEVAVSSAIANRGVRLGDTLRLTKDDRPFRVVGVVHDSRDQHQPIVLARPGAVRSAGDDRQWLVAAPHPIDWPQVEGLNGRGLVVRSRAMIEHPPAAAPATDTGMPPADLAIAGLIVALVALEVVLLAGPAFAVGLRRKRHRLALVAASGGTAAQLRHIVLAEGLVIGAGAALAGGAAGIGAAAFAMPVLNHRLDTAIGPFTVPWSQLVATVLLGTASGLAAAYLPARQAGRLDVVAALAGRRGTRRVRRGWPLAGAALVVAGVVVTVLGGHTGTFGVAAGAVLAVLGMAMLTPAAVGAVGAFAARLPLAPRLAVRDAVRNRGRTAPAVAAVLAAVTGVTALAIGGASDLAQRRHDYQPLYAAGTAVVKLPDLPDRSTRVTRPDARVGAAIAAVLPGVPVHRARVQSGRVSGCPAKRRCTVSLPVTPRLDGQFIAYQQGFVVGDAGVLRAFEGRADPAAAAALRAGKAVSFVPVHRNGGTTIATETESHGGRHRVVRRVRLPVVQVRPSLRQLAALLVLPPDQATRLGVGTRTSGYIIDPADHRVTRVQQRELTERMAAVVPDTTVTVEQGFTGSFTLAEVLLIAAGGVIVLGGTLVAAGLGAADARPDLATLAAIGAAPRTRRLLVMAQAALVAFLGAVLGLITGLLPGIAVTWPLTAVGGRWGAEAGVPDHGPTIAIPWPALAAIGLLVPLVAVAVTGIATRSRLPLLRRAAT